MIKSRLNHLLRGLPRRCRLVGIALLGLAACAPSQKNANRPSPPPGDAADAGSGGAMSEQELQACIDDCAQSQYDNPAETPYDCRAMCTEGVMR